MDSIALLDNDERRVYFEQASAEHGSLSPQLIEKDYWVCWTLRRLFSIDELGQVLTFKGGTSLSKVYDVIERFSEDIDLSIERAYLGFGGENEPEKGGSGKEQQRRIKQLQESCQFTVRERLLPALNQRIDEQFSKSAELKWELGFDPNQDDGQTFSFIYPRSVTENVSQYFDQAIKIEFGARSDHFPVEANTVRPYIVDLLSLTELDADVSVRALSAERTFWEKATILHAEFHRNPESAIPPRQSRHYYDLVQMSNHEIGERALDQPDLLARVSEHKSVFFKSGWANYGSAKFGSLKLSPPESRIDELKTDYADMQPMFFADAPGFDEIATHLKSLEVRINNTNL